MCINIYIYIFDPNRLHVLHDPCEIPFGIYTKNNQVNTAALETGPSRHYAGLIKGSPEMPVYNHDNISMGGSDPPPSYPSQTICLLSMGYICIRI